MFAADLKFITYIHVITNDYMYTLDYMFNH